MTKEICISTEITPSLEGNPIYIQHIPIITLAKSTIWYPKKDTGSLFEPLFNTTSFYANLIPSKRKSISVEKTSDPLQSTFLSETLLNGTMILQNQFSLRQQAA